MIPQFPVPTRRRIWPALAVAAAASSVLATSCGALPPRPAPTSTPSSVSAATEAQSTEADPPPAAAATTIPKNGTFLIGVDVVPGTYRTNGGDGCYWARESALSGKVSDIISNHFGGGQQVVAIAATDAAFMTRGCGTWTRIGD